MSNFDRAGIRQPGGARRTSARWQAAEPTEPQDAGGRSHGEARFDGDLRGLLAGVLDRREAELVEQAMAAVAAQSPDDELILRGMIVDLKATAELLEHQRPLRRPTALGGEARDEATLIDHLCTMDGLSGDLVLPLKAAHSRNYLLTKINFLRGVVKASSALGDSPASMRMTRDLRDELAQSIYTLLAEELFLALLRMPDVTHRTKRRAADQLITVWDDAALEIDDFAPLLESAWQARNRINSAYSTLLGATETFRLVREDCSPDVLEFFGREGMSADESAAFEEFLFNMTSEELETLRRALQQQRLSTASPAWASAVLGRQTEELEHAREIDPVALYRSYQRRQLAADFRVKSNAAGPRRTAEGYLMCNLLDQVVDAPVPDRDSFSPQLIGAGNEGPAGSTAARPDQGDANEGGG